MLFFSLVYVLGTRLGDVVVAAVVVVIVVVMVLVLIPD
jgi:hypothetical protein